MSRLVAIVACVVAGCVPDSYFCELDSDCNSGTAGRCEIDHRCTTIDQNCTPTGRRYTTHSGEQSDQCYVGTVELANGCMGGQPPAVADGASPCEVAVCELLPGCCTSGWTNACAAQAQMSCPELQCSTTIAVTASDADGAHAELWELTWTGDRWAASQQLADGVWFGYAAPIPGSGSVAPRKMMIALDAAFSLVVEGVAAPIVLAARRYVEASSVDFDRDRRDTIALTWTDFGTPPMTAGVELLHVGERVSRDIESSGFIAGLEWGAYENDAYPDAAAGRGIAQNPGQYTFLHNQADDGVTHILDAAAITNFGTPTAPATRSMQWADLDGDKVMDLVAFGSNARTHLSQHGSHPADNAVAALDCSPIHTGPFSKATCGDTEAADIVGTVVITKTTPQIVLGDTLTRELFRVTDVTENNPTPRPLLACVTSTPLAPAANDCAPFLAVVSRDLDHDGVSDIIAIDSHLRLFTSRDNGVSFSTETPIGDHAAVQFVRTAIAGEPNL